MLRLIGTIAVLAFASSAAIAQPPVDPPTAAEIAAHNALLNAPLPADQAALKTHVMFLASDAVAGREAGSHGTKLRTFAMPFRQYPALCESRRVHWHREHVSLR